MFEGLEEFFVPHVVGAAQSVEFNCALFLDVVEGCAFGFGVLGRKVIFVKSLNHFLLPKRLLKTVQLRELAHRGSVQLSH